MYLLQTCSTSHLEISVKSGTSPLRNPEAKATRIFAPPKPPVPRCALPWQVHQMIPGVRNLDEKLKYPKKGLPGYTLPEANGVLYNIIYIYMYIYIYGIYI